MKFQFNDGGRAAAGWKGTGGDCVTRAIAIAAELPYAEVYEAMARGNEQQRKSKRRNAASGRRTALRGIVTQRKWFKDYMAGLGFEFVATIGIGTGCRVHLYDGELPMGRLVVCVSKHYTAVIDGVIHDTYDPQREVHNVYPDDGRALDPGEWRNPNGICSVSRRCVYGYWRKKQ